MNADAVEARVLAHALGDPVRIAALLDGAAFPAALWSGADMRFTWTNPAFLDLLGDVRPRWDLLGMPVRGFLSDSHSASRFIDVAYTGHPLTVPEYEYRSSWGEVTHWQLSYLPVPGRLTDPFNVLFIGIEVSAEVRARVERERLSRELQQANEIIDLTVLSSLDADEILQRVLVEATEALGADWGWLADREDEAWVFRAVHGWPMEMRGLRFAEDDLSLPAYAARAARAVAVSQSDATHREEFELMLKHDVGGFALVPVKCRGEVTAVMGFCWDADIAFRDEHRDLLHKMEVSLSLALENARQYAAERALTRSLRGAYFTAPASVPGFEMGHLYHAVSGSGGVGGDFYDVVPLPDGSLGVLIGDVSGHGHEAAGLTSLVKNAMRAEALHLPSPRSVMSRANDLVVHGAEPHEFVSAFFGLIDPVDGRMSYSVAGHPPPVLHRAGEAPVLLPQDGVVLGASPIGGYENHQTLLAAGDLLVLYTDGLLEARSPSGEPFGSTRLLETVHEHARESTERLPEALFMSAFSFAGGRLADDIAIVTLRRSAGAEPPGQGRLDLSAAVA
ncbi:MAG: SpoIIE family protein phosphatase [Coriobacteriia bacterium]|nr:SpoIIE family protein phosphatase [Coriobacteriia bacterium]MBN2847288.1 SpoIIE family protein phosphatase [Coriobacteriia bacterium]